ncbi:MAG TPA: ECF-type sigma factor [Polyangiales bacterium]
MAGSEYGNVRGREHDLEVVTQPEGTLSRISFFLGRLAGGDGAALSQVFTVAYPELCALARARLRASGGGACDGLESGLVHEVFLRLAGRGTLRAEHRPHFFKYASAVMSSVIVDQARRRSAARRGGGQQPTGVWDEDQVECAADEQVIRLQQALQELAEHDAELAELVQMRFFAGLTELQAAEALGVTDRTVRRRWERARLFLLAALAAH